MIFINEELAKLYPKEVEPTYQFTLTDSGGNKILKVEKRLEGGVSNFIQTTCVRLFVEGTGSTTINGTALDIYKFGGIKFRQSNFIDADYQLPKGGTINGNGFVDVPVLCNDETFELTLTFNGNPKYLYAAINGTITNFTKDLLDKYKKANP